MPRRREDAATPPRRRPNAGPAVPAPTAAAIGDIGSRDTWRPTSQPAAPTPFPVAATPPPHLDATFRPTRLPTGRPTQLPTPRPTSRPTSQPTPAGDAAGAGAGTAPPTAARTSRKGDAGGDAFDWTPILITFLVVAVVATAYGLYRWNQARGPEDPFTGQRRPRKAARSSHARLRDEGGGLELI